MPLVVVWKRSSAPAIDVGGEQPRLHFSDPGRCRPIDGKVQGAEFRLPEVVVVSRYLRDAAVRKSAYRLAQAAALRALGQYIVHACDVVGVVFLEIVDARGKSVGPHRRVDQAGSEGMPRLRREPGVTAE